MDVMEREIYYLNKTKNHVTIETKNYFQKSKFI